MARAPGTRADIRRWFPEARSVVLCAWSYGRPSPKPPPGEGRIAAYARAPDYHPRLRSLMKELLDWFCREASPGASGRLFVDTSPVLERLYAREAGIGWVGKNTLLLSRRLGSTFLLSGMAVDRELVYDRPSPDHCGACNRCLRACPTQAFPEPRVLDASRCVAYFTVEHRARPIPEEFRPGVGDWAFGCDDCQAACPWTRFAAAKGPLSQEGGRSSLPEGAPRVLNPTLPPSLPLEELASLTPAEFDRRFKDTPLHRTGLAALLRNVLLVMGNSGDPRWRAVLEKSLSHEDPMVAEQAAWSLSRLDKTSKAI